MGGERRGEGKKTDRREYVRERGKKREILIYPDTYKVMAEREMHTN